MTKGRVHHIDLSVSDLQRSTRFYDFCLIRMGFSRIADVAEGPLWAGESMELGLQQATVKHPHQRYAPGLHHLAFQAPSIQAVDDLFLQLKSQSIVILDPPALYEQYCPGYYAVFFSDPDGIKLECVYTPVWPA